MQILSEIQSLTQMLFSYPFAMNLITLIEIILFFSPSPTISQISYFLPSNTVFKKKHVQRFLSSFNVGFIFVMFIKKIESKRALIVKESKSIKIEEQFEKD
jgi:hypothetical protein